MPGGLTRGVSKKTQTLSLALSFNPGFPAQQPTWVYLDPTLRTWKPGPVDAQCAGRRPEDTEMSWPNRPKVGGFAEQTDVG